MATIGRLIVRIGANVADLEKGLQSAEQVVSHADKRFTHLGEAMSGPLAKGAKLAEGALVGVGAALAGIGAGLVITAKSGLAFADEMNVAMGTLEAQTGANAEELSVYDEIVQGLFVNNLYSESVQDVAETMATVQQVTHTSAEEVGQLSDYALILRERFGVDVAESIMTANTLMENFGLTGELAYDFITYGIQQGLDASGDFLDTVNEYSGLFAQSGGSAARFFSLLQQGQQGGVLGTDKMADAFKEFQIRFLEGGDEINTALTLLTGEGIEYFRMAMAETGINAVDIFNLIATGIGTIEDPILAQQVGVAAMGTQFEDLGKQAFETFDIFEVSIGDMIGATQRAGESTGSLQQMTESLGRQFLVAIEPAAAIILPLLAEGIERVGGFLERAMPIFTAFAGDLETTVGPAMLLIEDAALRIATVLGLATEESTGMDLALGALKTTLDLVVTGIEAVAVVAQKLAEAFEIAQDLADLLGIINQFSVGEVLTATSKGLGFGGREISTIGTPLSQIQIPGMQTGGMVPGMLGEPQLMMAHGGEVFIPTHRPDFEGMMGPSVVEVVLNVDGHEMARRMVPIMGQWAKRVARMGGHARL